MKTLILPLLLLISFESFGQKTELITDPKLLTVKEGKYTLLFTNNDNTIDTLTEKRLIKTFFEVYPKLAKEYNKNTVKRVYMMVDTSYAGVAETDNAHVRISSKWMHKKPEDIDVVTHEVMHIVQDYGQSNGPGWLTEGIADYARNQFGINNAAAKWSLGDYKAGTNYDNAYRVTARFLLWIENHHKKGIVKVLDKQMRDHAYVDSVWKDQTGKTLDELWAEYAANPAL